MDKLAFAGQLVGFSSKVDGSLSLRVNTQEVDEGEIADIASCRNAFGWWHFFPNQEQDVEDAPPETDAHRDDGKSPSQRLRDIMYVLHKEMQKQGLTNVPFQTFYLQSFEKICEHYKAKIRKLEAA